jgi:hypothetical protein
MAPISHDDHHPVVDSTSSSASQSLHLWSEGERADGGAQWYECNDSSVRELDSLAVDRLLDGEPLALGSYETAATPYLAVYEADEGSEEGEAGGAATSPLPVPEAIQRIFEANIAKLLRGGDNSYSLISAHNNNDDDNNHHHHNDNGNGRGGSLGCSRRGFGGGGGRLVS